MRDVDKQKLKAMLQPIVEKEAKISTIFHKDFPERFNRVWGKQYFFAGNFVRLAWPKEFLDALAKTKQELAEKKTEDFDNMCTAALDLAKQFQALKCYLHAKLGEPQLLPELQTPEEKEAYILAAHPVASQWVGPTPWDCFVGLKWGLPIEKHVGRSEILRIPGIKGTAWSRFDGRGLREVQDENPWTSRATVMTYDEKTKTRRPMYEFRQIREDTPNATIYRMLEPIKTKEEAQIEELKEQLRIALLIRADGPSKDNTSSSSGDKAP